MRFNQVFLEHVHKTLKRVRIKVDPRHASFENYKHIDSYEGYILEENDHMVKIMVLKTGTPVLEIPADVLAKPGLLDHFKYFIYKQKQILDSDPLFCNIKNATSFEDLEAVLKQHNTTDAELVSLYRGFTKNHE